MTPLRTVVVAILGLAAVSGTVFLLRDGDVALPSLTEALPGTQGSSTSGLSGTPSAGGPYTGLTEVVARVTPAVVSIQVKAKAEAPELPEAFRDPRFRRFFGNPDETPRERSGVGSGVIVDAAQGYILTNSHVVDGATDIAVTLQDRRTLAAKMIGQDPATDLALVKVDAKDLTALPLGNMADIRVGDYVMAVGNPFGLGQTVTSGIVSALGRSGFIADGYEDFIQTDAAINPGNSGGALVNLKGELVGIPTVIIGPGGNIGIGFAVPISIAANVMDQLIQSGEVSRSRIGVAIQDLTPEVAQNLGLDVHTGALVSRVEPDGPADAAGVKAGDVVIALNERAIDGSSVLRNRVAFTKPGEKVKLTVIRDGDRRDIDITVERMPASQQAAAAGPSRAEPSRVMGAVVSDDKGGVRVRDVEENSPAAAIGLQAGDLITAVNRQPVETAAQLEKILSGSRSQAVLFVQREDRDMVLVVP